MCPTSEKVATTSGPLALAVRDAGGRIAELDVREPADFGARRDAEPLRDRVSDVVADPLLTEEGGREPDTARLVVRCRGSSGDGWSRKDAYRSNADRYPCPLHERRLQAPCTTPRSLSGPAISRRRRVLRSLPTRSLDDRSSRASTGIGCTVSVPNSDIQVRALWCRAESAFARGDHSDAIGDAERIIALEPFREQAYVMLMRAQVDAGNNAEALATYERLRETLASELGASPSPTTEAAFIDVLRAT